MVDMYIESILSACIFTAYSLLIRLAGLLHSYSLHGQGAGPDLSVTLKCPVDSLSLKSRIRTPQLC